MAAYLNSLEMTRGQQQASTGFYYKADNTQSVSSIGNITWFRPPSISINPLLLFFKERTNVSQRFPWYFISAKLGTGTKKRTKTHN